MHVGEILLEHAWAEPRAVARAIAEHRHTGKRLCSLLIARGMLDPDLASRALGEQHAVAAALQRHLEHRDRSLAKLLPTALARACFALPIGRTGDGAVVVCVRDPRPELHTAIVQAIGGVVVIAVAPATQLEHLIDLAYEPSPSDEFDVDMSTGPIHAPGPIAPGPIAPGPIAPGSLSDLGEIMLVGLDDIRVTKDLVPNNQFGRSQAPSIPPQSAASTIADATALLDRAPSRDAAIDIAMRFAQRRWAAAVLMVVKSSVAQGHRGHGLSDDAAHAVIPLSAPSIIKVAHDWRRLATEPPQGSGTVQEQLVRLLGKPRAAMAAPIIVETRVVCIIAVGEPLGAGDATFDLDRLAGALGDAFTRVVTR